jgi:ComF family protein
MIDARGVFRWPAGWLEALDALAFPLSCAICSADGQKTPFCAECRAELLAAAGPACARCALPVGPWATTRNGCSRCRGKSLGFDAAIALGPYQGPVRDLCLRLKKERGAWLAPWLADLLAEARAPDLAAFPDALVVPIPLHWMRRCTRGYNQSEALADRLAARLRLKSIHSLRRVASTPPLTDLGRVERSDVMRQVFRIPTMTRLKGRTVLLVDDILTSGATCGAAARALKRAGAARVVAVVVGRAEGRV